MERIYQQRDWQKIILGDIKQTPGFTENYGTTASRKHILNKSIRLMAIYSFCTAIAGFLMWWLPNYAVAIVAGFFFGLLFFQGALYHGFILLKLRIYNEIKQYFDIRKALTENSSFLEKLQKNDIKKEGIDPLLVEQISSTVQAVGKAFTHLEKSIMIINKGLWYLSPNAKIELREAILSEKSWMIEYMRNFQSILGAWMLHHESELKEIIQQNKKIQVAMPGGMNVITLANTQLDTHIESLAKVRIRL